MPLAMGTSEPRCSAVYVQSVPLKNCLNIASVGPASRWMQRIYNVHLVTANWNPAETAGSYF